MSASDLDLHGIVRAQNFQLFKKGEQKILATLALMPEKTIISLTAKNRFTVDWGDGVVQNFKSGDIAQHCYDFEKLAKPLNRNGTKEVIVIITPQKKYNLTDVDFDVMNEIDLVSSAQWIKIDGSMPNMRSAILIKSTVKKRHPRLNHYAINI